jgi:3-isopropylmalate dehydrogenase
MRSDFNIAVLPGDGIGIEVMESALATLDALAAKLALRLHWNRLPGGARAYLDTGTAFSQEAMKEVERADAILFGAMGLPQVRYADGTEIAPQLDIRMHLELYAGVRPIRAIPGLPSPLRDPRSEQIDLVILREQTEGLYWSRGRGTMLDGDTAIDTLRITRAGSQRVFDFAFNLAEQRKARGRGGKVTCVDKAGVLRSFAFFQAVFLERAKRFPQILAETANIDAMALNLVRQPWQYDVVVTENMFGDILSDLGAAAIGGMGLAPSGDIGEKHALFQPCHGTAPDIAGTGKANPTAMLLSAAMMMEWLGARHGVERAAEAGRLLEESVRYVFAAGTVVPFEFGGNDGTAPITNAVLAQINAS